MGPLMKIQVKLCVFVHNHSYILNILATNILQYKPMINLIKMLVIMYVGLALSAFILIDISLCRLFGIRNTFLISLFFNSNLHCFPVQPQQYQTMTDDAFEGSVFVTVYFVQHCKQKLVRDLFNRMCSECMCDNVFSIFYQTEITPKM